MRNALIAFVIATAVTGVARAQTESIDARRGLLTPAPIPPNRVIDPVRDAPARVWISRAPVGSRTPILEQTRPEPGPAQYGATADAPPRVVFVRIDQQAVAIDPWSRIEGRGDLANLERARHQWLREHGYVGRVRTHVNRPVDPGARADALPPPRAVIEVHEPIEYTPVVRMSLPPGAAPLGPARVIETAVSAQSPNAPGSLAAAIEPSDAD